MYCDHISIHILHDKVLCTMISPHKEKEEKKKSIFFILNYGNKDHTTESSI